MQSGLLHHFDTIAAAGIVAAGGVLASILRRAWPLLLPVPALLGALAWYGWEFPSEGAPLAVGIALFGYGGLALGLGARRIIRQRR